MAALKQLKAFTGIQGYGDLIDYLIWALTHCFPVYKTFLLIAGWLPWLV